MAEALVNHYLGDRWQAFSAGVAPHGVNPFAVLALRELEIEIPDASSKHMDVFKGKHFDRVITLCDEANEACPLWLGSTRREHIGFPDPSQAMGDDAARLQVFREVRDLIKDHILAELSQ